VNWYGGENAGLVIVFLNREARKEREGFIEVRDAAWSIVRDYLPQRHEGTEFCFFGQIKETFEIGDPDTCPTKQREESLENSRQAPAFPRSGHTTPVFIPQ
jgi:hypothetical protein